MHALKSIPHNAGNLDSYQTLFATDTGVRT